MQDRFVLRNEYFGGILHDFSRFSVEILSKEQFELLKGMDNGKGRQKAKELRENDPEVNSLLSKLENLGAVRDYETLDTRLVEHPIDLPEGTLASPLRVYDTYGYGCNLNCKRCLNKSSRARLDKNRRSLDSSEKIMTKFYEAGTMEWRFTGGEPTVYRDLLDAIDIAKGLGMGIMLNTNGCWDDDQYEPLLSSGVSAIIVSLEGREEINDRLREKGVYQHVLRTLDAIKAHNTSNPGNEIGVTINQTVGAENVGEVPFVVNLAAEYGYNINFVPARPYGRATVDDMLSTEGFMEFSRTVQKLRQDKYIRQSGITIIHRNMDLFNPEMPDKSKYPFPFNYSHCGALSTGFGLSPDGHVNACSFLADNPEFVGLKLSDDGVNVYDAWLDPKMERIRKAQRPACNKCDYYMRQCEGTCFAMTVAEGGRIENGAWIGGDRYCFGNLMQNESARRNQ